MICLKNRTFAVSQTTANGMFVWVSPLWFAWKIVLLQYRKQQANAMHYPDSVVICLKNRTFAVSQTTNTLSNRTANGLWFAWKIVLLQYRKQLTMLLAAMKLSCDLLEKSYFCSIANNITAFDNLVRMVVICLKNRTFAVSQTTYSRYSSTGLLLWFAWKIVLLQYRKQPITSNSTRVFSCDLLEKSYFCSIANNNLITF